MCAIYVNGKPPRVFKCWEDMLRRCNNPKYAKYKNYGGRGIYVCKEWGDYSNFYTWAMANGYEDSLQIDRKDNDGPYSPDNCRWVSASQNMRNRRVTKYITAWGETKS